MIKVIVSVFLLVNIALAYRMALPHPTQHENVAAGPFCVACEFLVQYVDTELKNNATDAKIIEGMERICGVAPPSLRKECVSLADTYGPYLIQLFVQYAQPQAVCQAISLC